jgi:hypothetical protein
MELVRKYIFPLLLFAILTPNTATSQDTLYLQRDSLMISTGTKVLFRNGTQIIRNTNGEVVEGVLKDNTYLWTGRRLLVFKENLPVRFNDSGIVIAGYLGEIAHLSTKTLNLPVRNNSYVEFCNEGYLLQGELLRDLEIDVKGKRVEFRRATPIFFNNAGLLVGGTINRKEQFHDQSGEEQTYKAGTTLFFNDKWEVAFAQEPD